MVKNQSILNLDLVSEPGQEIKIRRAVKRLGKTPEGNIRREVRETQNKIKY